MKALLIIDMQRGSFTADTPRHNADKVIENINALSAAFRADGSDVIFIQHDGSAHQNFMPGSEEWGLLPDLVCRDSDKYVSKTANDCFYQSQLNDLLRLNNISELVITGCATDFCVDCTIKSAFTRQYNVTVISDGHTTADRESIPAENLMAHYNWVWENMLPIASVNLRVMSCNDYLSLSGKGDFE